jgi:hypothetical protein
MNRSPWNLLIWFGLALVVKDVGAANGKYRTLDDYVSSIPQASIEISAQGDLNRDNLDDVALSLALPHDGEDKLRRLVVLIRSVDGSYSEAARSGTDDIQPTNGSSRHETELWIENGSLFYSYKNFWRGCGNRTRYQFGWHESGLRLIGATRTDGSNEGDAPRLVKNDVNLATGVEQLLVNDKLIKTKKLSRRPLYLNDFPYSDKALFLIRPVLTHCEEK